ncbi:MAG: hypothetical protein WC802_05505 [Patescibacteria group bacterium]|jgi:hypothetical protein
MSTTQTGVKTAELLALPARAGMSAKTMFHTLPNGKGWIFGVFLMDVHEDAGGERLGHIAGSHLEHLANDVSGEANAPRRFEQMLSALNADLLAVAKDIRLKTEKMNGVVGLVTKTQVFISGIGNISTLFLHKTADRRYSVYELDAQFSEGRSADDPRYFHTILDGEAHGGDVFYVGTHMNSHTLSTDELHDILVTLPPVGALQRIRQFAPPAEAYAAVAFAFTEEEKPSNAPRLANPIGSLEALQHAKERTANVLGESPSELSSLFKNLGQSLRKGLSAPGTRGAVAMLKRFGLLILALVGKGLSASQKLFANIFLANTGKARGGKSIITPAKAGAFLAILAVIVIASGVLFMSKGRKERVRAETAFAQTKSSVESDILAAEASLIYRNTEEARKSVKEASSILETLQPTTSAQIKTVETLTVKLAEVEDKIRGIITVTPQTLATLVPTAGEGSLTTVVPASGALYAVTSNLDVYRLDGLKSSWVKEDIAKGLLESARAGTPEGGNALIIDLNKQLGRADFTAHTLNPIQSGTTAMLSVEDVVSYGSNLYALSAGSGQVVKMRPLGTAYEAGTPWIVSKDSDLTNARAIAIDGDVYILTTHDVLRFHSGKEDHWVHTAIDPELVNPVDMWTDIGSKFLYILDPGSSRVIVMNKTTGNIEAQYTAPDFKNAVGFSIEESANRIVVVTGNQALGFTAEHLVK